MLKEEYLKKLYKIDPLTGAYIIEINIDYYLEVFNDLDRAQLKCRDIDSELERFLHECSIEVPFKSPFIIRFYIRLDKINMEREGALREGIRTYYYFLKELEQEKIKNNMKLSLKYAAYALVFLILWNYLQKNYGNEIVRATILEGLLVGSWVLLWECFSNIFFKNDDNKRNIKEYERLIKSKIQFVYP